MNPRRISLISCLAMFLFLPALALGLTLTNTSPSGWLASGALLLWVTSLEALLLLCAAHVKKEPDLVRLCLTSMGVLFLALLVLTLGLPSICS